MIPIREVFCTPLANSYYSLYGQRSEPFNQKSYSKWILSSKYMKQQRSLNKSRMIVNNMNIRRKRQLGEAILQQ